MPQVSPSVAEHSSEYAGAQARWHGCERLQALCLISPTCKPIKERRGRQANQQGTLLGAVNVQEIIRTSYHNRATAELGYLRRELPVCKPRLGFGVSPFCSLHRKPMVQSVTLSMRISKAHQKRGGAPSETVAYQSHCLQEVVVVAIMIIVVLGTVDTNPDRIRDAKVRGLGTL